ncbi:MAG: hydrogenase formation protein HypD [Cyclobacteriaceae bacterium]|nr:hydrogenase formation protein HypD [Cyclobacteriaceae bacterium]
MTKELQTYRNADLAKSLLRQIEKEVSRPLRIMEVCGGHTMAIHKYGINNLLPDDIQLISGPGCPVCVTPVAYMDILLQIAMQPDVIIASYGDLMRVPGNLGNLEAVRAKGADVRLVISPLDALKKAKENPGKKVVFPAIGFETTAPGTAVALLKAREMDVDNFFVLASHRTMPEAMQKLASGKINIDGFIGPGHVSCITGSDVYGFLASKYGIPVVISGFEPIDLLMSLLMILKQARLSKAVVENQYDRAVKPAGNVQAQKIMYSVFESCDAEWRGLGKINGSGLEIRESFGKWNALQHFKTSPVASNEDKRCICGKILTGLKDPGQCPLFGAQCTPEQPVGACMVSHEGTCNAWYRFKFMSNGNNTSTSRQRRKINA